MPGRNQPTKEDLICIYCGKLQKNERAYTVHTTACSKIRKHLKSLQFSIADAQINDDNTDDHKDICKNMADDMIFDDNSSNQSSENDVEKALCLIKWKSMKNSWNRTILIF